jgi:protein TonB
VSIEVAHAPTWWAAPTFDTELNKSSGGRMFENSLLPSSESLLKHQGLTAFVSFVLETIIVGALIIVPMLFTDALPLRGLKRIADIPAPPRVPQTEPIPIVRQSHQQEINLNQVIRVSQNIPRSTIRPIDPQALPPTLADPFASNVPARQTNTQISDVLNFPRTAPPRNGSPPTKRWRVSGGVEQGLLIQEVKPVYPPPARQAGVQGEVILQAVIGKDGRIQNLRVISGNPLLVKAARDAVIQWRYRPYLLDGEPVEVETQITVNFKAS